MKVIVVTDCSRFSDLPRALRHYSQVLAHHAVTSLVLREQGMPFAEYRECCRTLAEAGPGKVIAHAGSIHSMSDMRTLVGDGTVAGVHWSRATLVSGRLLPTHHTFDAIPFSYSAHSEAEADDFLNAWLNAPFVFLSPIFPTPKPFAIQPLGLEYLHQWHGAGKRIALLGGITRKHLPALIPFQPWGVGAIGAFVNHDWEEFLEAAQAI
ncbi:thiamine phosphate synthase [Chrysiogenes arsenatis]|uniref:thiamine phosphate synthase n=1 Tax=Chrysiogenes arsenatis TaxID=309797 RepID=UPI0004229B02|nr:thiamine phosphate synthase [Chrysiogenes arsenatis]